jgi:ABC-type Fe3+ transport system substrate-binding protein
MDRRRRVPAISMALIAVALAGGLCAKAFAAPSDQDILTYRGADREAKLVDGAKKEGEVVLYSTMIVNQALRPLAEAFMQKYPFVKATYWRGDTDELMAKVNAEMQADNLVADLIEGSLGEDAVKAGVTQRFYTPVLGDFPEAYRDPQGNWIPTRLNYFSLAYNTKLVAPELVPKTYLDLLDPRWKGKMAWRIDPCCGNILFLTNLQRAWGEERAMDYFRKLAQQKIINFAAGSARTLVDRVLAGEYPIAINIFAHHPLISAAKGASVNSRLLDPVPSTAAEVLVLRGLRHPYSAMLFADFLLSREGQEVLAKAEYFPARPDVAPLPELAPVVPARAGVPENFISPTELVKDSARSQQIFEALFR